MSPAGRTITTAFFICLALLSASAQTTYSGPATPVPETYFGMHINNRTHPWPSIGFGTVRLWDTGVKWSSINTAPGSYNWSNLDAWLTLAQSKGVQVVYTLGSTPSFAASNPSQSGCAYGPGTCSPPDLTDWDNFVTALVRHSVQQSQLGQGRINYYELWNEPNNLPYWTGTINQLVTQSQHAYKIIKTYDPGAIVLTPSPTWTSTSPWQWMSSYLGAAAATGDPDAPFAAVVAFHAYLGKPAPESVVSSIRNMSAAMASYGVGNLPLWDTEDSWGTSSVISDWSTQAQFAARSLILQWLAGVDRLYWYGWDYSPWGTLWDSSNGIHPAGVAVGQIHNWLVGATLSGCSVSSDNTWVCSLTRPGGYVAEIVWNPSLTKSFTFASQFPQLRTISGATNSISGAVMIGPSPVMAEASSVSNLVASLSVSPLSGSVPLTVTAATANSVDSNGSIVSSQIDFGDGTVVAATTASHTYQVAGTFNVKGTVTDNHGLSDSATVTVSAQVAGPPVAVLSVSPNSGVAPITVTASTAGSSAPSGAYITSISIDFGDGTTVSASSTAHRYRMAGTFTVKATVTDNKGLSAIATRTVTVQGAPSHRKLKPAAALSVAAGSAYSPLTVVASTKGSRTPAGSYIVYRRIDFGDGTVVSSAAANHTYARRGRYRVTATVVNNFGLSSTTATVISVQRPLRFRWRGYSSFELRRLQLLLRSRKSDY